MRHSFTPRGVCSREIQFDLEGNVVKNIKFIGGCPGNLKAIASLADGMTVEDITAKLSGNTCGFRDTSCPDQFAQAVQLAYQEENA